MTGFYMYYGGCEYFMESKIKPITDSLVIDFVNKVQNRTKRFCEISPSKIQFLKQHVCIAKCEMHDDWSSIIYRGEYCKRSVDVDNDRIFTEEG